MKNFLKIGIIIFSFLIITSCKKKTTEPKPQQNLDRQTAQGIAPSVATGIQVMVLGMFDPEGTSPMAFGKLGIKQSPCVTVTGDTSDFDQDGYLKNATATFDCHYQDPTYSFSLTGTAEIRDKDDNDPTSGFYLKFTDISYTLTTQGQTISWKLNATYDINHTGDQWGGHIDFSFNYMDNIVWSTSFDFSYIPDDPNKPWEGGTINFNGNYSVKYGGVNYSFQILAQNVHYNENSGCEYPDSGTVKITDGTNYLEVTFNCDSYTVSYNGTPVSY
ncbi:MAG: hypothetical protein ABIM98_02440 [candidate division WOR-3 bacterium]